MFSATHAVRLILAAALFAAMTAVLYGQTAPANKANPQEETRKLTYDPVKNEFIRDEKANRMRSRAKREPWRI